ncbi:MAG: bifunctional DNA-binding transcriptional regulator/O6-methylguanine-DNA methyltransferase Ada [Alphaproteobacteria bacterium]
MDVMTQTMTRLQDRKSAQWHAVRHRDGTADGRFVYAVKTTGVYCRPSCPARLARRENVAFFPDGTAARAAGFRPCRRCDPDGPSRRARHGLAVAQACRLIEEAETPPRLAELAAAVGLSRHHFHRIFKAATGVTPKAYAAQTRAARVRQELGAGESVTGALYEAGYNAPSRFYAEAEGRLGMKPSVYAKGGQGTAIRFAVAETSLGPVLIAATDKGVCAIELGDEAQALVESFQDRFPHADLEGGDAAFAAVVAQVCAYVETPSGSLDLPLDIQGTAFQQRVWEALRKIPAGTTASYTQIADAIGSPTAHRAVARACATNPVGLVVPCHRVVRTDGGISGYRWGVERKRALIAREADEAGSA